MSEMTNRTITWEQTGGKTHRVVVSDPVDDAAMADWVKQALALQNAYLGQEWYACNSFGAQQADSATQQAANDPSGRLIAWGSPLCGLFGSLW